MSDWPECERARTPNRVRALSRSRVRGEHAATSGAALVHGVGDHEIPQVGGVRDHVVPQPGDHVIPHGDDVCRSRVWPVDDQKLRCRCPAARDGARTLARRTFDVIDVIEILAH
jgi:hypothetical protein